MDMSCSLDVLVCRELPAQPSVSHSDAMAAVIKSTQAKIDAAFADGKVSARLRARRPQAA